MKRVLEGIFAVGLIVAGFVFGQSDASFHMWGVVLIGGGFLLIVFRDPRK